MLLNDNPYPGSLIYAYGPRDETRKGWLRTFLQILWIIEYGSIIHDEINLIKPGKNYGCPVIQGDEKRRVWKLRFSKVA
ncbi:PQQ-dependent sugar dehydrogenase [Candidatus Coxiella mudrowiae]|uniref:PQQ-dependent sugar dehydrogenase n=1 Tax=Candidatus Coxiella mudrowiae TaxID=2054173 RepID=UPI0006624A44|nr:PQQ-dependent sugar dehydrogenase [Candidatus Coxiella mudrowiae]